MLVKGLYTLSEHISLCEIIPNRCQRLSELCSDPQEKKILEDGFPLEGRRLLNINVPPPSHGKYRGFRITHAGHRAYGNDAQVHYNPRGVEYYWIGLPLMQWSANPKKESRKSDFEAVKEGYVSITPVQLDMTSYEDIPTLGKWL